jgi:hypothetical protein
MSCCSKEKVYNQNKGCSCPSPCCEGKWKKEDWNWAIVNAYKNLFTAEKRLLCNYKTLQDKLDYDYKCDSSAEKSVDKTKQHRDAIKREIKRYKYGVHCLCMCELQNLFEKVKRFEKCEIAATNVLIQTDDRWVRENPFCASREDWEMFSVNLCALLKLDIAVSKYQENTCEIQTSVTTEETEQCAVDVEVVAEDIECDINTSVEVDKSDDCEIEVALSKEDIMCNIAFDITRSVQFCDLLVSLAIIKYSCDMGLMFDVHKEQCKIEWEILLEKNPTCEISLKTYIKCKEAGITYELIQLIIDSGMNIQSKDGELFILGLLQNYKLESLNFYGMPPRTPETENFYKDPERFVEKYLKDYNLTKLQIEKILQR